MKILFTGASSFTGYWFVKQLINEGHDITLTLTRPSVESYEGIRRVRLSELEKNCDILENCFFGDENFLMAAEDTDAVCHHGHDNKNYRSMDYDILEAVQGATYNLDKVLDKLSKKPSSFLVLTGTYIEDGEANGRGFFDSPYGKSKDQTYLKFKSSCENHNVRLGKFVIPNPFGPLEEDRFTSYLCKTWSEEKEPKVKHPSYIRDNIHVSLLAKYYSFFVRQVSNTSSLLSRLAPSQYCETQIDFASRFSKEMEARMKISCPIEAAINVTYTEPMERLNSDSITSVLEGWDEKESWDQIADFYKKMYNIS